MGAFSLDLSCDLEPVYLKLNRDFYLNPCYFSKDWFLFFSPSPIQSLVFSEESNFTALDDSMIPGLSFVVHDYKRHELKLYPPSWKSFRSSTIFSITIMSLNPHCFMQYDGVCDFPPCGSAVLDCSGMDSALHFFRIGD